MTRTIYGEINGLVCVRYWLDAWDSRGWKKTSYRRVWDCGKLGFLASDFFKARVNAWESEVVEDSEIYNDDKRGYYASLPPFFRQYITSSNLVGIVEATGRIDIHEGGAIRAEKMQILHLFIPSSCDTTYLAGIRKRYSVHNNLVGNIFEAVDDWLLKNDWVEEHNKQLL